jgi:hypothetical protein
MRTGWSAIDKDRFWSEGYFKLVPEAFGSGQGRATITSPIKLKQTTVQVSPD